MAPSPEDPIGRVVNAEFIRTAISPVDKAENMDVPVGYIQLYAKISDQDAIQKILDGRYLTVSIGCSTTDVKCSVCDQQISGGNLCEHIRGKRYDGKLCYTCHITFFTIHFLSPRNCHKLNCQYTLPNFLT